MASAIKYLSNVGKSIKYASVDVIKDMNPVIMDAIDTNKDVLQATYDTAKNFKKITNKAYRTIAESEIGRTVHDAKKNLFEDLKHGTFYNRERREKSQNDFFENEWANDDAFSFDTGDDDFGDDEFGMDDLADTVDSVGEKASSAVSQVIARGAEYQVQAQKQSTMQIVMAQQAMSTMLHTDLNMMNTNIGNLLQFNTQYMTSHINNSANFYARQQEQMNEQTAILKEILDVTKRNLEVQGKEKGKEKLTMSDILTSNGALDIKAYAKYIKQDMSSSGMLEASMDMIKGGAKEFAASPLTFAVQAAVKHAIPGVLKESMASFNNTMSTVMSNLLLKITDVDDEDSIFGKIKSIFGVKERYKHGYSVAEYNKGKANWTGKDHKALTEVIPILLSKIYSAVSETDELRYDYNSGRFVKAFSIKKQWDDLRKSDIRSAGGDMYTAIVDEIRKMQFSNAADRQQLHDDLDKIMEYNLTNMKAFNRNNTKLSPADYGMTGGAKSEYNLQLIKDIIKRLPKGRQLELQQAQAIMNTVTSSRNRSKKYEEEGDSIFNILHDGSFDSSKAKSKSAPVHKLSSLDYLQGINKEVAYIRELLTEALPRMTSGYSGGKKKKGHNPQPTPSHLPSFSSYSFYGDKYYEETTHEAEQATITENGGFVYGGTYADEQAQNVDEQKAEKTFLDKMVEANTLHEKFKVIMGGVNDLAKAPAKFLAGVISKADQRIYHMLFGSGSKNEDDDSTVMGKIGASLNKWLDQITEETKGRWENVKQKFSKEKVAEFFQKFMAGFGIDKDAMSQSATEYFFGPGEESFFGGIKNMFKKGFSNIWGGIKNSFKSVWGWMKPARDEVFGVKNAAGLAKEQRNKDARDFNMRLNSFAADIDSLDSDDDIIEQAAAGMRKVRKTGLVAVSAGEMIVPPDQNPYNIKRRAHDEQVAIRRYEKFFGKKNSGIRGYSAGTNWAFYEPNQGSSSFDINNLTPREILQHQDDTQWFVNFVMVDKEQIRVLFAKLKTQEWGDQAISLIKKKVKEIDQNKNKYRKQRESFKREDYDENHMPLHYRMMDTAKDGWDDIKQNATDLMNDDKIKNMMDKLGKESRSEAFSDALSDVHKNLSKYLPDVAAGGVTGAGLSMMLGLMGGPLVGAAMGASIGLIKNSEKVQNWLFGEEIMDGNGNKARKGGLISASLSTKIMKYFPDMSKGAIVGGITSILPFVPGGPIAGILVGSAVGFAKNNEAMKNSIFGEETAIGKGLKAIKQKLPKMGLGALVGAITGPFGGLATNLLVGSAIGFASDTNKMKDLLYGKEGFDGVRHGGLAGAIKDHFNRATDMLESIFKDFKKDFIDKDIINPMRDFFKPLKQQGNLILRWIKSSIREMFVDKVGHRIGSFFYKFLVSSESKLGKLLFGKENEEGKRRGGLFGTAWKTATLPFRALGGVGRSMRIHQLKTGKADDLNAEQRLAERERLFGNGTGQNRVHKFIANNRVLNAMTFGRYSTGAHSYDNWYSSDLNMSEMDSKTAGDLADRIEQVKFYKNKGQYKKKMFAAYAKAPLDQLDSMVKKGECSDEAYRAIRKAISKGEVNTVRNMVKALPITPEDAKELAVKKLTEAAQKMKDALSDWGDKEELRRKMVEELQAAGFNDIDVNDPKALERLVLNLRREQGAKAADSDEQHLENKEHEKQKKSPMYQLQEKLHDDLVNRLDRIIDRMKPPEVEYYGEDDIEVLDANGNPIPHGGDDTVDTTAESINNVAGLIAQSNNNPTAGEQQISEGLRELMIIQQQQLALVERQTSKPQYTTTSLGKPLVLTSGRNGEPIVDESSAENREALAEQEEAQNKQSGVFSKIAAGFSNISSFLFGEKDDNGEKKSSGLLGTILGIGKSALTSKIGLSLAGLASVGILGMEVNTKTQKTDMYGNPIYDENGNPIMEKKTIGDIILDTGKKLWLGEDGTGNTSGVWYFIKSFTTETLLPALGDGMEWVFDKGLPWAVEALVSKLPQLIVSAFKGAWSWFTGDSDDEPSSSDINTTFNATDGSTLTATAFGSTGSTNPLMNVSPVQKTGSATKTNYSSSNSGSTSAIYSTGTASVNTTKTTTTNNINSTTASSTGNKKLSALQSFNSKNVSVNASGQVLKYANGATVPERISNWVFENWDMITPWGVPLGELIQDHETVLVSGQTGDGENIIITGGNILQYCSYMPDLGLLYFGVDLSLTDEERKTIKQELGYDLPDKSAADRTMHAINNIILRGGSANLKGVKAINAVNRAVSNGLKKIPVLGKGASLYYNATVTAPGRIAEFANDMVYSTRKSGSLVTGAKTAWGNFKGKKMDPVTGEVLEEAIEKTGKKKGFISSAIDKIKNKGTSTPNPTLNASSVVDDVSEAVAKTSDASSAIKKLGAEAVSGEAAEAAAKATSGIKGFLTDNKVVKGLKDALSKITGKVTDISDNVIKKALTDFAEKIGKKFTGKLGQMAAKAVAKVAEAVSPAVVILIAEALAYFAKGCYDADVILGVKDPSALERILGGIINAINEVFLLGLLPLDDVINVLWSVLCTAFPDLKNSSFTKRREELDAEVEAYNKANGTNLTEEEYLKKDKGLYKVWNSDEMSVVRGVTGAVGDVVGGVISGVGDAGKGIFSGGKKILQGDILGGLGDMGKGVVKGVGSVAGGVWNGAKNIVGGAVKTVGSVAKDIGGFLFGSEEKVVSTGKTKKKKGIIGKAWSGIKSLFGRNDDEKDDESKSDNSSAVQQILDSETGTIITTNPDGTIPTTPTLGTNGLPNLIISDENQRLLDGTISEVNSAIPGMVTTFKNKLASLFGLNDGSGSGDLLSMAKNSVKSLIKHNPASVFMSKIKGVWSKLTDKANVMESQADSSDMTGISNAANTINNTNSSLVRLTPVDSDTKLSSNTASSLSTITAAGSGVAGKGSGDAVLEKDPAITSFISQKYSRFASQPFRSTSGEVESPTVADAGCAPASASMVINMNPLSKSRLTMKDAIKNAKKYKLPGAGVSADYFANELHDHGLDTAYVTNSNSSKNDIIINQLRQGNAVVLRGIDPDNSNKNKSPFGPSAHYVVATGISPDGQYIYINDPEARDAKISYSIDKVLKATDLGIIPTVNRLRKTSSAVLNKIKKTLKNFTAGSIGTIVYVGDSRTVGMGTAVGATQVIQFIGKVGAGYSWLTEAGGAAEQTKNTLSKIPNAVVVFNFGINDLGNIDKYIEYYTTFLSESASQNIWFMSVNPVTDGQTTVTNANIEEFNKKIKSFAGDKYIDSYTYLQSDGFNATDGLHYDNNTYIKLHEFVVSRISGNVSFEINGILDTYQAFDELAKYYGISSNTSSGGFKLTTINNYDTLSESEASAIGIHGNVSSDSNIAGIQRALVAQMRKVQGTLKYAQGNENYPGSRNPDDGSGDCSSTIAWAYKNVTGEDVGSWTGAMRDASSTYTAATSLSDESKLQLGDLLLMDGHVEMYAGNNQMIGHGDPDKLGPTMKSLGSSPPYNLVRRLKDFEGSGSGNTFISQIGPKYKNMVIGDETVEDAGCAPATATMATNILNRGSSTRDYTMDKAVRLASSYKLPGSGVTADYFVDQFDQNGFSTMMMGGKKAKDQITTMLRGKVGAVVLLGKNNTNKSKTSSPFGPSNHYVLATKISSDGRYIWVNDPEQQKTARYPIDKVLPYVSMGIAPVTKGENRALDSATKKISKMLKQYHGGAGTYADNSNEAIVWNYLTNFTDFSDIVKAGIMGNIYGESAFNTQAIEKGSGKGYGLIQWTGGRRTAYENWAKQQPLYDAGKDGYGNIQLQLKFLLLELSPDSGYFQFYDNNAKYYGTKEYNYVSFIAADNITDATLAFMTCFERCTNVNFEAAASKRINAATGYYEAFTGNTTDETLKGQLSTNDDEVSDILDGGTISSFTDLYSYFDKLASAYGIGSLSEGTMLSATQPTTVHKYLNKLSEWVGTTHGSDNHKYIVKQYNDNKLESNPAITEDDTIKQAAFTTAGYLTNNKSILANTANSDQAQTWYKNNGLDITYPKWNDLNIGDQVYFYDEVGTVFDYNNRKPEVISIDNKNNIKKKSVSDTTPIKFAARPAWAETVLDPEIGTTTANTSYSNTGDEADHSSDTITVGNCGTGVLETYTKLSSRSVNDPEAIGKLKELSGRGSNITTPNYLKSSNTTKVLSTPNLSSAKSYSRTSTNISAPNPNDSTNKLVDIVIRLLAQVVDNTTSIKDIAALLTALVNSKELTNSNNTTSSSSSNASTKAMMLKVLSEVASSNTKNSTLDSLIKNVEAIAAQ